MPETSQRDGSTTRRAVRVIFVTSIVLAIAGRIVSGVWGDVTAPYEDAAIATAGWDVFLASMLGALLSGGWLLAQPAR